MANQVRCCHNIEQRRRRWRGQQQAAAATTTCGGGTHQLFCDGLEQPLAVPAPHLRLVGVEASFEGVDLSSHVELWWETAAAARVARLAALTCQSFQFVQRLKGCGCDLLRSLGAVVQTRRGQGAGRAAWSGQVLPADACCAREVHAAPPTHLFHGTIGGRSQNLALRCNTQLGCDAGAAHGGGTRGEARRGAGVYHGAQPSQHSRWSHPRLFHPSVPGIPPSPTQGRRPPAVRHPPVRLSSRRVKSRSAKMPLLLPRIRSSYACRGGGEDEHTFRCSA